LVYSSKRVDVHQSLAAALFVRLPSWLRDHPSPASPDRKLLRCTIKNLTSRRLFDQRKYHPTGIECAASLAVSRPSSNSDCRKEMLSAG
jgi:hypothetical protein